MTRSRRHRLKREYIMRTPVHVCPWCGQPISGEVLVKEVAYRKFQP